MFKKHRQDCEHPKNAQFDIYAITSNFFNKFPWNFATKNDNYVTNLNTKIFWWKPKLLKRIDKKINVLVLLRISFTQK